MSHNNIHKTSSGISTRRLFLISFTFLLAIGWKSFLFTQEIVIAAENTQTASGGFISRYDPENAYRPSPNAMMDVDVALKHAARTNKRLLIVLGGNWCHDSQGLIRHFTDQKMDKILKENYVTVIVDVGYLDKGADITRRFGLPVYFATPTVLIVDPETETLINKDNMHQWRDADSISLKETRKYFSAMALKNLPSQEEQTSEELGALLAEIKAYEKSQVERIYEAYKVIGPLLALDRDKRPKHFNPYWMELRKLRYNLPEQISALRKEAKKRLRKGEKNIKLTYPVYAPFSWEKKS